MILWTQGTREKEIPGSQSGRSSEQGPTYQLVKAKRLNRDPKSLSPGCLLAYGSDEEKTGGLRRQYNYEDAGRFEVVMQVAEMVHALLVHFSPDLVSWGWGHIGEVRALFTVKWLKPTCSNLLSLWVNIYGPPTKHTVSSLILKLITLILCQMWKLSPQCLP